MSTIFTIDNLKLDGGTQPREAISQDVVDEYAEAMRNGAEFPAIEAFADDEENVWLADGFHRYYAALQAGLETLPANIRPGSARDAILYSVGANGKHGLRRSNADKRRAVEKLLGDEEWRQWSDHVIADKCGVSQPFVSEVRKQFSGDNGYHLNRKGADGKTYLGGLSTCEECGAKVQPLGLSMISKKWFCPTCIEKELQQVNTAPIEDDKLYYFLGVQHAPDGKAHYAPCSLQNNENACWALAKNLAPTVQVVHGRNMKPSVKAQPDQWVCDRYDQFARLAQATKQPVPAAPAPVYHYATPAYCGQCDEELDDWIEVQYGAVSRWKCPKCGMEMPDGLMRRHKPAASPVAPDPVQQDTEAYLKSIIGEDDVTWESARGFGPGQSAHCRHCVRLGWIEAGNGPYSYERWTQTEKPGIWRCPQRHRIADHLLLIQVKEEPTEQGDRADQPDPSDPSDQADPAQMPFSLRAFYSRINRRYREAGRCIYNIYRDHGERAALEAIWAVEAVDKCVEQISRRSGMAEDALAQMGWHWTGQEWVKGKRKKKQETA